MSGPAPICVACRLKMRCKKNNRLVADPEAGGFPSSYWVGDEWECPECGVRIVTGFGKARDAHPGSDYGEALVFDYQRPREGGAG